MKKQYFFHDCTIRPSRLVFQETPELVPQTDSQESKAEVPYLTEEKLGMLSAEMSHDQNTQVQMAEISEEQRLEMELDAAIKEAGDNFTKKFMSDYSENGIKKSPDREKTEFVQAKLTAFLEKGSDARWPIELQKQWMGYIGSNIFSVSDYFLRYGDETFEIGMKDHFDELEGLVNAEKTMTFDAWLWKTHPAKFMEIFGQVNRLPKTEN